MTFVSSISFWGLKTKNQTPNFIVLIFVVVAIRKKAWLLLFSNYVGKKSIHCLELDNSD